jgi:hypothetical protein
LKSGEGHGAIEAAADGNDLDTYAVYTVNQDQLNADLPAFIRRA